MISIGEHSNLYLVKIVMIGSRAIGKTNLLFQFCCNDFKEIYIPTIGIDFKTQLIDIGSKKMKAQLWDIGSAERFQSFTEYHIKGAQGVIMMYSITDVDSFDQIGR
jgi:small GTP-binding protein